MSTSNSNIEVSPDIGRNLTYLTEVGWHKRRISGDVSTILHIDACVCLLRELNWWCFCDYEWLLLMGSQKELNKKRLKIFSTTGWQNDHKNASSTMTSDRPPGFHRPTRVIPPAPPAPRPRAQPGPSPRLLTRPRTSPRCFSTSFFSNKFPLKHFLCYKKSPHFSGNPFHEPIKNSYLFPAEIWN